MPVAQGDAVGTEGGDTAMYAERTSVSLPLALVAVSVTSYVPAAV